MLLFYQLASRGTHISFVHLQVKKALPAGSTDNLSFKTLVTLAIGLAVWILYGFLKIEYVVVLDNAVGISLVATLIAFKVRDTR